MKTVFANFEIPAPIIFYDSNSAVLYAANGIFLQMPAEN